ncbi:MAG: hypothetical protein IPJ18_19845 [Betaproteobacteria bacterium]|nr:hypothetical protein [Betaproteobacteria bacterium]
MAARFVNGGTFTNAVEIGEMAELETGSSGGTISGALSGSGALVKTGTGALLFQWSSHKFQHVRRT